LGNEDNKEVAGQLLDTLSSGKTIEFHECLVRVRDDSKVRSVTVDALLSLDRTGEPKSRVAVSKVFAFISSYCSNDIEIEKALTSLFRYHYTSDGLNRLHEALVVRTFFSEHDILLNLVTIFTLASYKAAHEVCDAAEVVFKGTPFESSIFDRRLRIKPN
jgi:hypothetical protein